MKRMIIILLAFALVLSVSISAFGEGSEVENLTGKKLEYRCYKINSAYYFQSEETGKWYRYGFSSNHMRPAKEGGMELVPYIREFNVENYFSDNDTQTVVYEGKTYTVDCKNKVSYLDGIVDDATTEKVRNIFKDAELYCRALDFDKKTYISIPYSKVVIENEFCPDVYSFDERIISSGWASNIVNEAYSNVPLFITYGDANVDGTINMQDIVEVQKSIANLENDTFIYSTDVIADNTVNMKDVVAVQRSIAGLI